MKKFIAFSVLLILLTSCQKKDEIVYLPDFSELKFRESVFDYTVSAKFESEKPVFIYVYSNTCPSCSLAEPVIEKLAEKFYSKVSFLKLDVATTSNFLDKFNIHVVPGYIFMKSGDLIDSLTTLQGLKEYDDLKKIVEQEFDL